MKINRTIDKDGNGKIDFGEFFLIALFTKLDIDRNGFIEYDEAKYIANKHSKILLENGIETNSVDDVLLSMENPDFFEGLDVTGDGKLDFEEFRKSIIGKLLLKGFQDKNSLTTASSQCFAIL